MKTKYQTMKLTPHFLLATYLFITASSLAFLFLTWNTGSTAGMANSLSIVILFGLICVLSVVFFMAFRFSKASIRIYAIAAGMLCIWGMVVAGNLGADIRWALTPSGHCYSVEYRNHSQQDIFVAGVGPLRSFKDRDCGIKVVYQLPRKIVWWNGSSGANARPADGAFLVQPPEQLKYLDHVIFTLNEASRWDVSIELP